MKLEKINNFKDEIQTINELVPIQKAKVIRSENFILYKLANDESLTMLFENETGN